MTAIGGLQMNGEGGNTANAKEQILDKGIRNLTILVKLQGTFVAISSKNHRSEIPCLVPQIPNDLVRCKSPETGISGSNLPGIQKSLEMGISVVIPQQKTKRALGGTTILIFSPFSSRGRQEIPIMSVQTN